MSVEADVAKIKACVENISKRQDEQIKIQKSFCELRHKPLEVHIEEGKVFRDMVNKHGAVMPILITIVLLIVGGVFTTLFFIIRAKIMGIG